MSGPYDMSSIYASGADPLSAGLAGLAQAFGQGGMPSRLPVPFGAVLGQAAGGMQQGIDQAAKSAGLMQTARGQQIQNQAAASQLPLTEARNNMLKGVYQQLQSNPDLLKQMMGGGDALSPAAASSGGATPLAGATASPTSGSSASPPLQNPLNAALSSLPSDDLRKKTINAALGAGMTQAEIPHWIATVNGESGWNPAVKDNKNTNGTYDVGLGQVNSSNFGPYGLTDQSARDPQANLNASAKIFHSAWAGGAGGDPIKTMAAYNTGNPNGTPPSYAGPALQKVAGWGGLPQSSVQPGGVQDLLARAQQAAQRANLADLGIPFAGDAPTLRAQSKSYIDAAIGLQTAGPMAGAKKQAEANVEMQTAPAIAGATEMAKVPGQVAAAGGMANAQMPFKLAEQGFKIGPNGTLAPIQGGMADPDYVGQKEAAQSLAKAQNQLLSTRDGRVASINNGVFTPLGQLPTLQKTEDSLGNKYWGNVGGEGPVGGAPGISFNLPGTNGAPPGAITPVAGQPPAAVPGASAAPPGASPQGAPSTSPPAAGAGSSSPPTVPGGQLAEIGPYARERLQTSAKLDGDAINQDQKMIDAEQEHVIGLAIPGQATLLKMRDQIANAPTGAGAQSRLQMANWAHTYLPSSVANAIVPDPTAGQIFNKSALQIAGADERADMGSRGSAAALGMYVNAHPNLDMSAQANKEMTNAFLIAHQANVDYAQGATGYFNQQRQAYTQPGSTSSYTPIANEYDNKYGKTVTPAVIYAAMDAINGKPQAEWSKGLGNDPKNIQLVAGIVKRADPTAAIDIGGKPIPVSAIGKATTPNQALGYENAP